MAQLQPPVYTLHGVTRFPRQELLVVEASTLGLRPGHAWDQLYDDACDVGIVLRSPRTGAVVRWFLSATLCDQEGDAEAWILKPCSESLHLHPQLTDYRLKILND